MSSEGQGWALRQLQEISDASAGTFEIVDLFEPDQEGAGLVVIISMSCLGFRHQEGGVPLKSRERLRLKVPAAFPFSRPEVYFTHKRYADFPHVQWGDYICLYQAPDVEWQVARGMFGFIQRLNEWLRAGAADELDPYGMPLHPPVAYSVGGLSIVIRENTPEPAPPYWSGYAQVTRENEHVAELGQWIERGTQIPEGRLATAILLPGTMPHEYPATMLDLLKALVARGIAVEVIRAIMTIGVLRTPVGKRAIFVLGAAMRGIAGGKRLQHLACWRIDSERTDTLRSAAVDATEENPIDITSFYEWALEAKVEWCRVLEDRPEIVERRDSKSAASWWRNKNVVLLGCGATGSAAALILARAGVGKIQLFDNGIIKPGILIRQAFLHDHVGYTKVSAVKLYVAAASPGVKATAEHRCVVSLLDDTQRMAEILDADVIVDATASSTVSAAIECHFRKSPGNRPPLVSLVLGHNADFGMMTLASPVFPGLSMDLDRRSKLAFAASSKGQRFSEEFWPTNPQRRKPFQPEPGCSSPTFRGSYADVLGLTARMTNIAALWLSKSDLISRSFAMNLSGGGIATGPSREIEISWLPYSILNERRHGYELRLSQEAMAAIMSWTKRSERIRGSRTETGGVLFGQVDEFLKVVWIDEVSGPPPDSIASPEIFVCGVAGVKEMNDEKIKRNSGSVSFVGMWHTHPLGLPIPSPIDLAAMAQLLKDKDAYRGRHFLMLIVGGTSKSPTMSAGMFKRSDYAES